MTYELFALRYGIGRERTANDNFIPVPGFEYPAGDPSLYCYVWAAVGGDRVVLIDGGASEETAAGRGIDYERHPVDSLRDLGLGPEEVSDVVLTHLHWDHAGNLAAFGHARFHLHAAETAYATGPAMAHRYLRRPYDRGQLADLIALIHDGRVEFNPGVAEIAPGITAHHLGGHTPGLQVVRVETARGPVVVASDAMHYLDNGRTGVPFPVVVHLDDYCAAAAELTRLAGAPERIIAGHDPAVAAAYPSAIPGNDLIVRLDAEPEFQPN